MIGDPDFARLNEALDEIKARIEDGVPPDTAISEAAADHDLPVKLLNNRAVKAFGSLTELKAKRDAAQASLPTKMSRAAARSRLPKQRLAYDASTTCQ